MSDEEKIREVVRESLARREAYERWLQFWTDCFYGHLMEDGEELPLRASEARADIITFPASSDAIAADILIALAGRKE